MSEVDFRIGWPGPTSGDTGVQGRSLGHLAGSGFSSLGTDLAILRLECLAHAHHVMASGEVRQRAHFPRSGVDEGCAYAGRVPPAEAIGARVGLMGLMA